MVSKREFVYLTENGYRQARRLPRNSKRLLETDSDATESDVFISHATEDKAYVEPLVKALESAGISVWLDKRAMEWGDDLRPGIDRGLTSCRYGIVVFSRAFLAKKKWTEYELNALFALEQPGRKIILPIWHGITRDDLINYSPAFADRLAKRSSTDSYEEIVDSLLSLLGRLEQPKSSAVDRSPSVAAISQKEKPNAIAYAWYETKGDGARKAKAFIRPSTHQDGCFTFEDSFGQEEHGPKEAIAAKFFTFDRGLKAKGYTLMQHASSDPAFSL